MLLQPYRTEKNSQDKDSRLYQSSSGWLFFLNFSLAKSFSMQLIIIYIMGDIFHFQKHKIELYLLSCNLCDRKEWKWAIRHKGCHIAWQYMCWQHIWYHTPHYLTTCVAWECHNPPNYMCYMGVSCPLLPDYMCYMGVSHPTRPDYMCYMKVSCPVLPDYMCCMGVSHQ